MQGYKGNILQWFGDIGLRDKKEVARQMVIINKRKDDRDRALAEETEKAILEMMGQNVHFESKSMTKADADGLVGQRLKKLEGVDFEI